MKRSFEYTNAGNKFDGHSSETYEKKKLTLLKLMLAFFTEFFRCSSMSSTKTPVRG